MLYRKNSNKSISPKESSFNDSVDKNFSYDLVEEKLNGNYSKSKKPLSKNETDNINKLTKTLSPRRISKVKQLSKRLIELRHSFLYLQNSSEEKKKKKKI